MTYALNIEEMFYYFIYHIFKITVTLMFSISGKIGKRINQFS